MKIEQPQTLFVNAKTFGSIETIYDGAKVKVVVIFDGANATLSAAENDLLFKILGAVKVEQSEVAILHSEANNASIATIKKQFGADYILLFTTNAKVLSSNMQIPSYQLLELSGVKILRAAPISLIISKPEHKAVLWNNLKLMFGI